MQLTQNFVRCFSLRRQPVWCFWWLLKGTPFCTLDIRVIWQITSFNSMSIVLDKVMCVFLSFLTATTVDYRIKMDKNHLLSHLTISSEIHASCETDDIPQANHRKKQKF